MIYLLTDPQQLRMKWIFESRQAVYVIGRDGCEKQQLVDMLVAVDDVCALDPKSAMIVRSIAGIEVELLSDDKRPVVLIEGDVVISMNAYNDTLMAWKEFFGPPYLELKEGSPVFTAPAPRTT